MNLIGSFHADEYGKGFHQLALWDKLYVYCYSH